MENAILIQKTVKGFIVRRQIDRQREDELVFLGIKKKKRDPNDPNSEAFKRSQK